MGEEVSAMLQNNMKILGYILIALAILDFALYTLRLYDLTGWQYTPLVAGLVGSFCVDRGKKAEVKSE